MNKFFRIYVLTLLFLSCSSDLDFDQANDLKLEPIFVANLAAFDIQANQFVIGGVEQPLVGDVVNFKVFNDVDFTNNLSRTDLYFEFNNTINRGFSINLHLLDANNVKLHTIPFTVPAYTPGQSPVTKTEIFENAKLDILKKTEKIAFVIAIMPGIPLTSNSLGSLKMRSSATIYFAVQ
ncbi:hypothetical protein FNW25_07810 [Flavobacterium franklandianum]|uniref:Uncharacterized protein n=1 Tax=Flavobacterium franklandianum TaxID=2594430 RepID=A0A553CJR6_9FLAO|nr:hypothetical protein [Flavobacterium franklandianum]TRX20745.1 hypothetical protein FNW17_10220 [Flavobacterium franklandianum]TRX26786.1 hypothetical protein FNW25_07810 [Flavobacterium franklandianum]